MKNNASVGKKITLKLTKNNSESEKLKIILVDADKPYGFYRGLTSLNSPLGRCIFKKKVGFKGTYSVLSDNFEVEILQIE